MIRTLSVLSIVLLLSCSRKQEVIINEVESPVVSEKVIRQKPISQANLLAAIENESEVKDSHFWQYNDGKFRHHTPGAPPLFDETESQLGTDGSFVLVNAKDNYTDDDKYDMLLIKESTYNIPVKANTIYTLSFMARVEQICPSPGLLINFRSDVSGKFRTFHTESVLLKEKNSWQEVTSVFKSPEQDANLSFQIINYQTHSPYECHSCNCESGNEDCWPIYIDEFYLAEGVTLREVRQPKVAYNGDPLRRIDALGNIELKKGGKWEPFFPLMIYSHNSRMTPGQANDKQVYYANTPNDTSDDGFKLYKKMGFNTVAWAGPRHSFLTAVEAGLYGNIDLTGYGYYKDEATLAEDIDYLKTQNLEQHVLFFYHDNEDNFKIDYIDWQSFLETTKQKTTVPIYQLNGNPGNIGRYNNQNCKLVDISGTYFNQNNQRYNLSNRTNIVNVPTAIAQINSAINRPIRPQVYHALASGAKGIGYFRDQPYKKTLGLQEYNISGDISNAIWFEDFKHIAHEINQMIPVIRTTHMTDWTIKISAPNEDIKFGTRMYQDGAYLFLANYAEQTHYQEIELIGINLENSIVKNFHTNETVALVKQNKFKIKLSPGAGLLLSFIPE